VKNGERLRMGVGRRVKHLGKLGIHFRRSRVRGKGNCAWHPCTEARQHMVEQVAGDDVDKVGADFGLDHGRF
jgi:hypothetical protein